MQRAVDVAILGGGLAGNLLARQLRRHVPNASVAVYERETERTYKVGESTVEIAANYLVRRLGLSNYLYKEHLPKNGLRFFFDTEQKDAPLHEMSELGVAALPPCPSFQLDRARLERDLLVMNAEDGVEVNVGVRVADVTLDAEGGHVLRVVSEEGETEVRARWVVDALGRVGMLAKKLDLRVPEKSHRVAAVWARMTDVGDLDDTGVPEFHARAHWTSRALSTTHFMYPGYWIWFIPLREGLTSVGVVAERDAVPPGLLKMDGFLSHLRSHRVCAELVEDAEPIDIGQLTQLAFRTKQFFGDRVSLVGDAVAFGDPFYSPGSDFIALENDFTADLIARDLAGEDLRERRAAYEAFMHMRFEVMLMLYDGLYGTFGSYELFRAKCYFDTACYYNLWFDSYARDEHLDLRKVKGMVRRQGPVRVVMQSFADTFRKVAETLRAQGNYYRGNTGRHALGPEVFGAMQSVGHPRKRAEVDQVTETIFNKTRAMLVDMVEGEAAPAAPWTLMDFADRPDLLSRGPGASA